MPILTVDEAINVLIENGVISSPDYWKNTAIPVMNYVDGLIINAANAVKKDNTNKYSVFGDALTKCVEAKVITTPAYWSKAAVTNKYISNLIINIANHL